MSEDGLLDCLTEAVRGNVIVSESGEDSYSFRHALVREIVYEDSLPGERQHFHRALAARLVAEGVRDPATLAEVAHHLDKGRSLRAAVSAYVEAGTAAESVSAYPEAFSHLERALALHESAIREQADGQRNVDVALIRERAARYAYLSGDPQRAVELMEASLAEVDRVAEPERAALVLESMGDYLWSLGQTDRSIAVAGEAVALVRGLPPSLATSSVLTSWARVLVLARDWSRAEPAAQEGLEIARAVGARAQEGRALGNVGACHVRSDIEAGLTDLAEALSISNTVGDIEAVLHHHATIAAALHQVGDHPRSTDAFEQALSAVDRSGGALPIALILLADVAQILIDNGDWARTDALVARGLRLAGKGVEHHQAHFAAARLAAYRGKSDEALCHLETCWPFDKAVTPERHAAVRAEIFVTESRWLEARAQVRAGLDVSRSLSGVPYLLEAGLRAESELAAIARLHRDEAGLVEAIASARSLTSRLDELAAASGSAPTAWYLYSRAFCAAEMSRMHDRPDPVAWRAVIEVAETTGALYRTAYPRLRLAEALLERAADGGSAVGRASGSADRAEAAVELRKAHFLAVRLCARPLMHLTGALGARARISLDETAEARSIPMPDLRAPHSAARKLTDLGLSPREIEVLGVLIEGRTNRQIAQELFITEKTAAIHVSRILDKLGAANRVEAAASAHRLGLGAIPPSVTAVLN